MARHLDECVERSLCFQEKIIGDEEAVSFLIKIMDRDNMLERIKVASKRRR